MYKGLLDNYQQTLNSFVGLTKVFVSGDILQVSDYSWLDWEWSMLDPEVSISVMGLYFPRNARKYLRWGKRW